MKLTEIASIIGALSWSYPIGILVKNLISRPKIKIIPEDTFEIGYSTFGPIINFRCAISVEKKDAIIERIFAEVRHEDGETHDFVWKFLDEIQFEIRPFSGEGGGIIGRNQPAIALKVTTSSLAEKKIGFQDIKYQDIYNTHFTRLIDQMNHLQRTKASDINDELIATKEFTSLNDFFLNGMYWRKGSYSIRISVQTNFNKQRFIESINMILDNSDIELLKSNTLKLEPLIRSILSPAKEGEIAQYPPPIWNWVYPRVRRLKAT